MSPPRKKKRGPRRKPLDSIRARYAGERAPAGKDNIRGAPSVAATSGTPPSLLGDRVAETRRPHLSAAAAALFERRPSIRRPKECTARCVDEPNDAAETSPSTPTRSWAGDALDPRRRRGVGPRSRRPSAPVRAPQRHALVGRVVRGPFSGIAPLPPRADNPRLNGAPARVTAAARAILPYQSIISARVSVADVPMSAAGPPAAIGVRATAEHASAKEISSPGTQRQQCPL